MLPTSPLTSACQKHLDCLDHEKGHIDGFAGAAGVLIQLCSGDYRSVWAGGQNTIAFSADIVSMASAIPVLEANDQTPATQLVALPTCRPVAYWGAVQAVGVTEATRQCLLVEQKVNGVGNAAAAVLTIWALPVFIGIFYFFYMLLQSLGGG
ncbi:hypothetical protein [Deinococcus radiophilus]|uniref:hypothetical protein n=1 Tax=Deinococcus radiophilus TaxID=32062 RepID=UPI003614F8B4